MKRSEFLHIVEQENLDPGYKTLKGPGFSYVPYCYGWTYIEGKWCPYQTDERAGVMIFGEYNTESEALEELVEILRREKRIAEAKRKKA